MNYFTPENLFLTLNGLGVDADPELFAQLQSAYNQVNRYYHNQQHISYCLQKLSQFRDIADYPADIEIAFWFHDAIYDTKASDNELKSAQWAQNYLQQKKVNKQSIDRVFTMIMATQNHQAESRDSMLMNDIDLLVLGADKTKFAEYNRSVRLEYSWLAQAQFREGRKAVLQSFT